jgi:lipid II:glycine glycyltransferase (peptidoglycan interpeptide bridge formation enzyme)
VKLWVAEYQNRIISGALCFYSKRHVVYWHGAGLSDYFHLRPANLLLSEVIKHACEDGYWWFDFNPSGTHEGVANFKRRFGAKSMACPVIVRKSHFFQLLDMVKQSAGWIK